MKLTASGAHYYLTVIDHNNKIVGDIGKRYLLDLSYTRRVNHVTTLSATVTADIPSFWLAKDNRLVVWRQLPNMAGYIDTNTAWFIRARYTALDTIRVDAMSSLYLLSGRNCSYSSGVAEATYTGAADNVMKDIVRNNFLASGITTSRHIDDTVDGVDLSTYLTVAADLSAGPSLDAAISEQEVLKTLQNLSAASDNIGTAIYFDIDTIYNTDLTFVTIPGQRGRDMSSLVTFTETNNIENALLTEDWKREVTAGIAAGRFTDESKLIGTATDATRIAESPFSYREKFVNASTADDLQAQIDDAASAVVTEGKPLKQFSGDITDKPGSTYGIDWRFGDRVQVEAFGTRFTPMIDTVSVSYNRNGNNTIRGYIRL